MSEPRVKNIRKPVLPSWGANLMGFGLLTAIVIGIFFFQQITNNRNLQKNAFDRSKMIAGIIEKNLDNATSAQETIDALASSFLQDKARFIVYLDSVDPLQPIELEALAKETGLLGITIFRSADIRIAGPVNWDRRENQCSQPSNRIFYDLKNKRALLNYLAGEGDFPCIVLGIDAKAIIDLRTKTDLPVLFENLSSLPGIHYVKLEGKADNRNTVEKVNLIEKDGSHTAETRVETANGTLVVGLDAGNFIQRRNQLRRQFILFATLLFVLAIFFSWIIYKKQQAELQRTRQFERILAKEHESAALGRATSTIAHEIRNPLNAINMGLQRLQLESNNLEPDQLELILAMGDAVKRTSKIVGELQRFTKDMQPTYAPVNLENLINRLLTLYAIQAQKTAIHLDTKFEGGKRVEIDADLIGEIVENLLKNSIEAQPSGGFITLELIEKTGQICLTITNGGFTLEENEASRLGEPYFTTKTRGSGLGLALSRRIAEAHGGTLDIMPDYTAQQLRVVVKLPLTRPPESIQKPNTATKQYQGIHN